ncbi:DnaJ C-terminal domain-containing protein [Prochlorococcus marinus]|uniref:Molecular chaperone DnaJ n=1 Tax=Prochlorococcus marinus XMU1408 TaxID=2213228 RepID=A0A318R4F8_PROMR|nr:DnaJ C-terminal domain-containing protein [Prochlorococcus marinus]MBW3041276.1 molecular chaperone DnaJ [Prochlorococcus marinus str. XMU1408]PYE03864.1 molecular chaperone DnaJ [Prochlorococcus marinus XMU1408]
MELNGFKDYFKILGVSRNATDQEIKSAFRKLARKFHPDLHPYDEKAELKFKEINEAYETLSDQEKKKSYEQYLSYWFKNRNGKTQDSYDQNNGIGFDESLKFDDFLSDLIGRFSEVGQEIYSTISSDKKNQSLNLDAEFKLNITFFEAFNGTKKNLLVNNERLKVDIPKGIQSGSEICIKNKGNIQLGKGKRGDLLIKVNVQSHSIWKIKGLDIYADLPISLDELTLGANILVATPQGNAYLLIPSGSVPEQKLRLEGQGLHDLDAQGDLFFTLKLKLPEKWSDEELELLKKLRSVRLDEPRASWFDQAST